jgi:biotin synthase
VSEVTRILSAIEQGDRTTFLAGANSIFYGDRLLTAANPSVADDGELFGTLGLPAPAAAL